LCPQQMLRARANGETFVWATMCPRLPGPLGTAVRDLNLPRRKMHQFTNLTLFRNHRPIESALICQTR